MYTFFPDLWCIPFFLVFPRKMVYTIAFLLCDLGVGRQTEKRGVPRWWCILFFPWQLGHVYSTEASFALRGTLGYSPPSWARLALHSLSLYLTCYVSYVAAYHGSALPLGQHCRHFAAGTFKPQDSPHELCTRVASGMKKIYLERQFLEKIK